jgi:hypothetical protein
MPGNFRWKDRIADCSGERSREFQYVEEMKPGIVPYGNDGFSEEKDFRIVERASFSPLLHRKPAAHYLKAL